MDRGEEAEEGGGEEVGVCGAGVEGGGHFLVVFSSSSSFLCPLLCFGCWW